MFRDEDVVYARRLKEAGVDVHLEVLQGGYHGFDVFFSKSDVSRRFWESQCHAFEGGCAMKMH